MKLWMKNIIICVTFMLGVLIYYLQIGYYALGLLLLGVSTYFYLTSNDGRKPPIGF